MPDTRRVDPPSEPLPGEPKPESVPSPEPHTDEQRSDTPLGDIAEENELDASDF